MVWKPVLAALTLIFGLCCCFMPSQKLITVQGQDDPSEPAIQVDTHAYSKPYVISIGYQDWFLRGYIDKKTRIPSYQLYVIFNSANWMYWDNAAFHSESGLVKYTVNRISSDVSCDKDMCSYYEDVVVSIKRQTLEEWARTFAVIRFSSSRESGHRDIDIDPEEVKEFLVKMDAASEDLQRIR